MFELINKLLAHLRRLYFHAKLGGKIKPYDISAAVKDLEKLQAMAASLAHEHRQAIEDEAWHQSCAAICKDCFDGYAAYEDLDGYWFHSKSYGNVYCEAHMIRNRRKERNVL